METITNFYFLLSYVWFRNIFTLSSQLFKVKRIWDAKMKAC